MKTPVPERKTLDIGIVAGEASGDILAAGLVEAIHRLAPQIDIRLRGLGGPALQDQGLDSLFPIHEISIMGFDGLLRSLPRILHIRKAIVKEFTTRPPDVFVGVDVPDFNLWVESKIRSQSIPAIHYVSPTVWAWRSYRIHKIRRSVDHMLALFPFEADFYRRHDVPVTFVGHPMADEIRGDEDGLHFKKEFNLGNEEQIVALLPGSRASEIDRLGDIFIETALTMLQRHPGLRFVTPFATNDIRDRFNRVTSRELREKIGLIGVNGRAREVIAAADVALLASGTAALEAALLRRPMVVAYRASRLTEVFFKLFGKVKHVSMPNHLLKKPLIPEYIQDAATPANLANALEVWLNDTAKSNECKCKFAEMHERLKKNASLRAAQVVINIASGLPRDDTSLIRRYFDDVSSDQSMIYDFDKDDL